MSLYDDVFNRSTIYETFFFNVKAVLCEPDLDTLKSNNPVMYERWVYLSKTKYNDDWFDVNNSNKIYKENGVYLPEFSKIVAITYATLYNENGTIKRSFKKLVGDDEQYLILSFFDVLNQLSADSANSKYFPILCGYNIINYDIPFLIKRFIFNKNKFEENRRQIPLILKRALLLKPWDSGVIDVMTAWKFNGIGNSSLMLVSEFMGLKKTVDLMPLDKLSEYYWNSNDDHNKVLEVISLQSATQTNLTIQLLNELRLM